LRRLVGVRLEPRDEFAKIACRERSTRHDNQRIARHERNRFKIRHQIVWQCKHRTVQDMRCPVAQNERVSVRQCADDPADSDGARCTDHVFYDDRLAELRAHGLSHDASDDIGGPACPKWNHHCDGPAGVTLGACDARREWERGGTCDVMKAFASRTSHCHLGQTSGRRNTPFGAIKTRQMAIPPYKLT
jgi:hypothetical protein